MSGMLGTVTISGAVLGTIGHVISANGPNINQDIIDVSDSDSTFKEKILSLVDYGEIVVECNYDDAAFKVIHDAIVAETNSDTFTVTFKDTSKFTGVAWITNLATSGGVNDKRTMSFTLVCTAAWTHTVAA